MLFWSKLLPFGVAVMLLSACSQFSTILLPELPPIPSPEDSSFVYITFSPAEMRLQVKLGPCSAFFGSGGPAAQANGDILSTLVILAPGVYCVRVDDANLPDGFQYAEQELSISAAGMIFPEFQFHLPLAPPPPPPS